jgi:hypothetical protein
MDLFECIYGERDGLQVVQQLGGGGHQGGSMGARTDSDDGDDGGAGSTLVSASLAATR